MKITDVTLTLFAWESIPSTIYGHHTARPTGNSDLGLLRIATDEGIEGHAFLGTSSNPAGLDGRPDREEKDRGVELSRKVLRRGAAMARVL